MMIIDRHVVYIYVILSAGRFVRDSAMYLVELKKKNS